MHVCMLDKSNHKCIPKLKYKFFLQLQECCNTVNEFGKDLGIKVLTNNCENPQKNILYIKVSKYLQFLEMASACECTSPSKVF